MIIKIFCIKHTLSNCKIGEKWNHYKRKWETSFSYLMVNMFLRMIIRQTTVIRNKVSVQLIKWVYLYSALKWSFCSLWYFQLYNNTQYLSPTRAPATRSENRWSAEPMELSNRHFSGFCVPFAFQFLRDQLQNRWKSLPSL